MTKPTEKMQAIVKAAGGCWHNWQPPKMYSWQVECSVCGKTQAATVPTDNPSPTDLNTLFELAEKLDERVGIQNDGRTSYICSVWRESGWTFTCGADNPAETLLNALYEAVRDSHD